MSNRWEPLDWGRISDIARSKARFEELVEFHWDYYSELAFQRNRIREQLRTALREKAHPFEFSKWQRVVRYKYSLTPLSTKGSLVDPGGRFNVGEIDRTRYRVFPALYIAGDKGTALAETLGREKGMDSFTPEELALTKSDSITVVSVSGRLESVLDIRERKNLAAFIALIRNFRLSSSLIRKARRLDFPVQLVTTSAELVRVLTQPDWRNWPMVFDVPSACQIFGELVMDAGIEGIQYNSSLTDKECLAIFPQNFLNSSSYIELDDAVPAENVQRRIDSSNFTT
ncbi:MAG: RES family NAD+ phosphorylase [Terriglobales bacterium]